MDANRASLTAEAALELQPARGPAILHSIMTRQPLARVILSFGLLAMASGCSGDKPKGHCPAFSACGGSVEGAWAIDASCIDGNLMAVANLNPKLTMACQGMYQNVTGDMTGTVAFNAGAADIDTLMTITYQVSMNAECAASQGVITLDSANCADLGPTMVPSTVVDEPHQASACALEGSNCSCAVTDVVTTQESRTYTLSGSKIIYSGSADYLEFCVDGTVMHGRQFDSMLLSTIFMDANLQP